MAIILEKNTASFLGIQGFPWWIEKLPVSHQFPLNKVAEMVLDLQLEF